MVWAHRGATWTRIKPSLDQDITYKALMSDNNLKQVQLLVHGKSNNKLGGCPLKLKKIK
jgi:1,2-phenylacetyl-CoA epoxidase catalytic subunit